jgi:uncharacterized protein YneF (UPF0154 family)
MALLQQLFSDWVGILSIITVSFVLVMAVFIGFFVVRHVRDETHHPQAH